MLNKNISLIPLIPIKALNYPKTRIFLVSHVYFNSNYCIRSYGNVKCGVVKWDGFRHGVELSRGGYVSNKAKLFSWFLKYLCYLHVELQLCGFFTDIIGLFYTEEDSITESLT